MRAGATTGPYISPAAKPRADARSRCGTNPTARREANSSGNEVFLQKCGLRHAQPTDAGCDTLSQHAYPKTSLPDSLSPCAPCAPCARNPLWVQRLPTRLVETCEGRLRKHSRRLKPPGFTTQPCVNFPQPSLGLVGRMAPKR